MLLIYMVGTGKISTGLKAVLIAILGVVIIYIMFSNTVPTVLGNNTPHIWIMGTDFGWFGLLLPYILVAIAIFAIIAFL